MNKILVVDESKIFRNFAAYQMEYFGFQVLCSGSGFDGLNKMRTFCPDLLIVDDGLNRLSINNLLKKKLEDINLKDIPVIFISREFSQERIVELCRVKARRFLLKPLKVDQFLTTVSSFFKHDISIDDTQCQLNMHVNENLILVEVARGLNRLKLGLISWKIKEIIKVNNIDNPKIMLLISDVAVDDESSSILSVLLGSLQNIPDSTDGIKILTSDKQIKKAVKELPRYGDIDVCSSLIEAVEAFFGKKGLEKMTSNQDNVYQMFLSTGDNFVTRGILDLNF